MRFLSLFWIVIIILSAGSIGLAQREIDVRYIEEDMKIDGALNEAIWQENPGSGSFQQYFPSDTIPAKAQTDIQMCFDDKNLYVAIKCYGDGNDWIINSLRRDYRAGGNDNITLIFNPFNDGTIGNFFGINPAGVIREGTITGGGNSNANFDESWDNKWRGNAKIYDGYYTAEMEIPFSTLRYNDSNLEWELASYRFDTQSNEISTWTSIPRNQTPFCLAYMGKMIWEKPPPKSGKNISLIPYVSANYTKDFEDGTDAQIGGDLGGDMKVGITSGLNLDLTFNPDFSQVEVDRQITNLDRFELFFPERRQFFLENADLFSGFGFGRINPFFSRRIGIATDTTLDQTIQNQIIAGARLSGKLNDKLRLGFLNMQTGSNGQIGIDGNNFSVLTLQQKLWTRSNVGFIMVNRVNTDKPLDDEDAFNNTVGLDFNYASPDNTWSGQTFFHINSGSSVDGAPLAHGTSVNYSTRTWSFRWRHEYVHEDYDAQVGFVPRTDYVRINPFVEYQIITEDAYFNTHQIALGGFDIYMPGFGKTDHRRFLSWGAQTKNTERFGFELNHEYIYLSDSFDPTGTDSPELGADTDYNFFYITGSYRSDRRRIFSYVLQPLIGQYFNGFRSGLRTSVALRYQPRLNLSMDVTVNRFDMPHLDDIKYTALVGPRIDYTFSKEVFLTSFLQYNSQTGNTNINTRLQWRFAPASDFFLVYSDNYGQTNPDGTVDRFSLNVKNRAIVAKLSYWFNI